MAVPKRACKAAALPPRSDLPQEIPANLPVRGQLSAQVRFNGTISARNCWWMSPPTSCVLKEWAVGNLNARQHVDKDPRRKGRCRHRCNAGTAGQIRSWRRSCRCRSTWSSDLRAELHAHGLDRL